MVTSLMLVGRALPDQLPGVVHKPLASTFQETESARSACGKRQAAKMEAAMAADFRFIMDPTNRRLSMNPTNTEVFKSEFIMKSATSLHKSPVM